VDRGRPGGPGWTMNCGNFGDGCCVNDLNEFSRRFPSMSGVSRNSLSLCSGRAQATLTLRCASCDQKQVRGPARALVAERHVTNSVRAASLCSVSLPCAVRYSIPQRCFEPLAPLSCLPGVPAIGGNKNIVSGYEMKLLAELLRLGYPEFRHLQFNEACRTASHVSLIAVFPGA
jgi:hypothetical protein